MRHVVLVCGKMRSGKDQFAQFLKEEFESAGKKVSFDKFAQDLKDGCAHDFKDLAAIMNDRVSNVKAMITNFTSSHFTDMHSQAFMNEIVKNLNDLTIQPHNWYEDKTPVTRSILQIYGTEIFRDRVKESYWVDRVYDRVSNSENEITLVTDARFPNELDTFEKEYLGNNGLTAHSIKVFRDTGIVDNHPSETSLDDYELFNYIIDNNGTLDGLRETAKAVVEDILNASQE